MKAAAFRNVQYNLFRVISFCDTVFYTTLQDSNSQHCSQDVQLAPWNQKHMRVCSVNQSLMDSWAHCPGRSNVADVMS